MCMCHNLLIVFDKKPPFPLSRGACGRNLSLYVRCIFIHTSFNDNISSCLSLSEQWIIITYFPLSLCLSPAPSLHPQMSWPLGNLGRWSDLTLTAIFLCSEIKRKRAVWRMLCGICTYWTCYQRESSLKPLSLSLSLSLTQPFSLFVCVCVCVCAIGSSCNRHIPAQQDQTVFRLI